MTTTDIICISNHYWNDAWFRKQHFMSRLQRKGFRILYVQPSYSMVRQPKDPELSRNQFLFSRTVQESDSLYLYYPPQLLPKPSLPLSAKINYRWFSMLINRTARNIGMANPILWIYRPEYAVSTGIINHSHIVFDLIDDLAAYKDTAESRQYIDQCITALAEKSDLFVTTTSPLVSKYEYSNHNIALIPNGFDSIMFESSDRKLPDDLAKIKTPVVGFIGTLFKFLDYDLVFDVAARQSDKSFVFVGPEEKGGAQGVQKLSTLPNTYFLGRKDKSEIPAYIQHFDICINPFIVDNVSRSVSPLKVYEYLACGKPVISTYMEGLQKDPAGQYVEFAESVDDFARKLDTALSTDNEQQRQLRRDGISSMSWDHRFNTLYPLVEKMLLTNK